MNSRITYILLIFFSCFALLSTAQVTAVNNDPNAKFKQAQEYFLNDQFSLAMPLLRELKQEVQSSNVLNEGIQVQEIDFYLLACGLQQNDERAVLPSREFITVVHNMPRTQQLSFHLANYYFRKQEFVEALEFYERAEIASLNNEQISESKFRMGYAYFHIKRYQQAKPLFNTIRQLPEDKHYLDANYFYGFIAYNDKQYNEALSSFEKVQSHPEYGKIVPFYIASIYYFRGEKDKAIKIAEEAVYKTAGVRFNLASPKQLGEVLFEVMKIDKKPKKTPTGQYATGEDILLTYEAEHSIVKNILDFRELQKLKSTYVDALPALLSPTTGRIHTSYNQAVTATGRLSSTNPNLQNIPIRTPRGREIRKAFIPTDENYRIFSADYSQIELRIMAAFSGDESMLEAFNQGVDIHATTASKVFSVSLEDVTSDMRRKAKMVNFGIIYGISPFGLANRLAISRQEAKEIIDAYFLQFPKVKEYMDSCIQTAQEKEYVETILGRRRYLRDINSRNQTNRGYAERNAINAPIQGSAADLIKIAMIQIHAFMREQNMRSKMILQVHDELLFDAHVDELAVLQEKVNHFMTTAISLPVKLETGMGVGKNWLEAH